MPHIQLKLFATLTRYAPKKAEQFPIEAGTSIETLVRELEIPVEMVKLIFINGRKGLMTSSLEGGERVGLFPPVGGG